MKVKIGQKYKIINNGSHGFSIGTIVRITEIYSDDSFAARIDNLNEFSLYQYIHKQHIQEIITEINKNIKIL